MIMADVLTWFLIVAGTYLVLVCYWLASAALFPHVVEGCRQRYGRHPFLATLVGVGIVAPLLIAGIAAVRAIHHPAAGNAVKVLLLSPLLLASTGSAGLALRIGDGGPELMPPARASRDPGGRSCAGGSSSRLLSSSRSSAGSCCSPGC